MISKEECVTQDLSSFFVDAEQQRLLRGSLIRKRLIIFFGSIRKESSYFHFILQYPAGLAPPSCYAAKRITAPQPTGNSLVASCNNTDNNMKRRNSDRMILLE